ncbi:MAG: hypothetical protein IKL00_11090 [Oscillospiraceae bacterium]|nr:hypothetical protein [Oscillospiraceae bacterium]
MKAKKQRKPKYRNSILFICYLTGVFDRWFKRNKGAVEDAAFIAKRIAAFTDYSAMMMKLLEDTTENSRSEAQVIMSSLDDTESSKGASMGQKRARKLLEERKTKLIMLDGSIRKETVKAKEALLPYMEKLKAQTKAYAHGFSKKPIADSMLVALYSVEQNSAFIAYQKSNSVVDNAIHAKAKAFAGITEKEDE